MKMKKREINNNPLYSIMYRGVYERVRLLSLLCVCSYVWFLFVVFCFSIHIWLQWNQKEWLNDTHSNNKDDQRQRHIGVWLTHTYVLVFAHYTSRMQCWLVGWCASAYIRVYVVSNTCAAVMVYSWAVKNYIYSTFISSLSFFQLFSFVCVRWLSRSRFMIFYLCTCWVLSSWIGHTHTHQLIQTQFHFIEMKQCHQLCCSTIRKTISNEIKSTVWLNFHSFSF